VISWRFNQQTTGMLVDIPGLVNIQKNYGKIHHFSWGKSTISTGPFSIAFSMFTRGFSRNHIETIRNLQKPGKKTEKVDDCRLATFLGLMKNMSLLFELLFGVMKHMLRMSD